VTALLIVSAMAWGGRAALSDPPAPGTSLRASVDLLVVSDKPAWLTPLAATVAAKLAGSGEIPLLLVVESPLSAEALALLNHVSARHTWVLDASPDGSLSKQLAPWAPQTIAVSADALAASVAVARQFWEEYPMVVTANVEAPQAVIQGAVYAAQSRIPLLVAPPARLDQASAQLKAKLQVLYSDAGTPVGPHLLPHPLAALFGAKAIDNLILARVPDDIGAAGRTAWLAPYLSLLHHAPVILAPTRSAQAAEKLVNQTLQAEQLRPKTLTILADPESIGHQVVRIDEGTGTEKTYRVPIEPCSPTSSRQTAALGVGRIPLAALKDASLMVARGVVRSRATGPNPPALLLVANPAVDDWELPLCEVISRATAAEFKNCGVQVREFYQTQADVPAVRRAALDAQLIVYQGHIEQESLFKPPQAVRIDNLPVVILQTCDSLQQEIVWQIHAAGGTAVVGTATPVHSGPGSTLIKALCDAALYRSCTLGEALRDAQNYLFCFQDLKHPEKSEEWAKTERTALSFRLLGDPQLTLFPRPLPAPEQAALIATWDGNARIVVHLPPQQLPEVRSNGYVVRLFPGSETAGLLLRLRGGARKLAAMYFFRLPLPAGFPADRRSGTLLAADQAGRGVFRVDPLGRFLYVLYRGEHAPPGGVIILERVAGEPDPLALPPPVPTSGSKDR
jgi:hypothetical protein